MDSMSDQERAFHIMILIASWPLLASCSIARVDCSDPHVLTCIHSGTVRGLEWLGTFGRLAQIH